MEEGAGGVEWRRSEVDRRIWEEELADWLPSELIDAHAHVFYADEQNPGGAGVSAGGQVGIDVVEHWDRELLPDRSVSRFLVGMPFRKIDVRRMADFVLEQASDGGFAFPVVTPDMELSLLESLAADSRVIGLKPYRFYSTTGDPDECRINEYIPEEFLRIADERRLIVLLHLSKRRGPADPENLVDLARLAERYPNVVWQLAHCARSFNATFLEKSVGRLKEIPTLYFDTSAVCESDVFDILFSEIPIERILYGSDHLPVHVAGGKYAAFGDGWLYVTRGTEAVDSITYCDNRPAAVVYEELRAMKRSMKACGLDTDEKRHIFSENARRLAERATAGR